MKERVVVAMSGGVDSSVAALMLKEKGYEVLGVSLDLYDFSELEEGRAGTCCSLDDIYDARAVCDEIGVPHYVFNYRDLFDREVVDDFISEYSRGRTPNPCIVCNDIIKFKFLLDRATSLEARFLATGHYARIRKEEDGSYSLLKGIDGNKDQSYFLYRLGPEKLPHLIFPCGVHTKGEIRQMAEEAGLKVRDKGESQEICFITEGSYRDFLLDKGLREERGQVVDTEGRVIGTHRGVFHYTVGQRKGLGISADTPYYVIHVDGEHNRVIAGPEEFLYFSGAVAKKISFVGGKQPAENFNGEAVVRYRAEGIPAKVSIRKDEMSVIFDRKVKSVTPGQALVLYDGERVIGGGVITEALGDFDIDR